MPEDEKKYPDNIMESVRQNMDVEEDDTSRDEEIEAMDKKEVLSRVLEWNGICRYTDDIIQWINDIYDVNLEDYESNKKIIGQSFWHCDICDKAYVLEVELPGLKDDPYVYLGGIHVHAFTEKIDLPSIPVRISFNDRLRISDHADEVSTVLKEDC